MWLEILMILVVTWVIYCWSRGLEHVLIHQRWIFVCLFLLPLSVVFESWLKIRNWMVFKFASAPKRHEVRVKEIQDEIIRWSRDGRHQKMCTARSGWLTVSLRVGKYKATHKKISINLMDILKVDLNKETVLVEPLVTMGQLSSTLIPMGWTLPVVPELDMLTVGGLIMGFGVETSSFKHGLFQHICVSYDVLMASGELIHCSKHENAELFYHIPWSHGTLGFLVAAELKIIPAKSFVKLTYESFSSFDQMNQRLVEVVRNESLDFVECLAYSMNESVLMTGVLTNSCETSKVNAIGKFWKPWFYKHVETYLKRDTGDVEYIPLSDYFHRHTRSLFWELQDIIQFGNHPLFRYLLGWTMPPQISLLKITMPKMVLEFYEMKHVVQDMLVPLRALKDSLECFEKHVKIYPLWLCPFKLINQPGLVRPHGNMDEMYIDIGAYGSPKTTSFLGPDTVRRLESFVLQNKGYQALYADCYLNESDFRRMFNHTKYEKLRQKYNADEAFPTIFEKISRMHRV